MDCSHSIVTVLRFIAWSIAGLLVALFTVLSGLFLACSNLPFAWARYTMAIVFVTGAWLYGVGTITLGSVYLIFQYVEMANHPVEQISKGQSRPLHPRRNNPAGYQGSF